MKTCCHCKKPKLLKEFRLTRREADGHHRECNTCHAEYGRNQRLALHGMSQTDKNWLVQDHQKGVCPICLKPLLVGHAYIDHAHNCTNKMAHKSYKTRDCGCPLCIRGALHRRCNSRTLQELEQYPHLQIDAVKTYLAGRPFVDSKG